MKAKSFLMFILSTALILQASATVIQISSFEELCKIGQTPSYPLDGSYVLTQNIDASPSRDMDGGRGFTPIGNFDNPFSGSFDGNGHIIRGLYIRRFSYRDVDGGENVGLFSFVRNGEIKRVGLEDVSITGFRYAGSIASDIRNSTITDCYSTGEISINGSVIGGLIGSSSNSTITGCYSTVTVRGGTSGLSDVSLNAGGLVGYFANGIIINCYSIGTVSGIRNVGGLVGYLAQGSQIANSYSKGPVRGVMTTRSSYVGGLVGYIFSQMNSTVGATITNCYSRGAVSSSGDWIGGLVGAIFCNLTTINNCYSTGYVVVIGTGNNRGGFVGASLGTITNSFWNSDSSNLNTSAGGESRTTTQMKQLVTYTSWDFDSIWQIDEGTDYPYLLALAHTSIIENNITRNTAAAYVPLISIKGKTLYIKAAPSSELQIRIVDMRGKTLTRFNTHGSNSFSLSKIPAGRYLVEIKENGKRVTASAIVFK
ncbi:MAG: T9SS type A sorting domain-containing protein [Chitinispirillia bacterium]|nr:T9SS type A sorting domain-containing protein [Chitinispirillia bacterium]